MEDDLLLLCGDNGVLLGEADGLAKQLFRYAWVKICNIKFYEPPVCFGNGGEPVQHILGASPLLVLSIRPYLTT